MDPRGTGEAVGWVEMDQDKAKTPTEPTKEPAPDGGDFGELLITGMQALLGASDEDLRRWREQLVENSRPSRSMGTQAGTPVVLPPRSGHW
jgi:hypothetical protein